MPQEHKPKQGRPRHGENRRVRLSISVDERTAQILERKAEAAGSIGLAIDQLAEEKESEAKQG